MDPTPVIRAAQYVRMSTEHQRYSIAMQVTANAAFALERGYTLVRTYTDAGVSGLTLDRRHGLRALLDDVTSGRADFSVIVVFDVSRWGRFQDTDEAAHYEFLCRNAGLRIEYPAEPFEDDGTMLAALAKTLKRAMAAEFSRDLSAKVRRAKHDLGRKGFWQGGPPAYGLRRQPVTPDGRLRPLLEPGERNAMRGDRMRLALGPPQELAVVRRVFDAVVRGASLRSIAAALNAEGIPSPTNRRWTHQALSHILCNPAYIGVHVCGQTQTCLGERQAQPPSTWTRVDGAFEAAIPRALYARAQARPKRKHHPPQPSEAALLRPLAALFAQAGYLSSNLISADWRTYSPDAYRRRFGSLRAAYALVGYVPPPTLDSQERRRRGYNRPGQGTRRTVAQWGRRKR